MNSLHRASYKDWAQRWAQGCADNPVSTLLSGKPLYNTANFIKRGEYSVTDKGLLFPLGVMDLTGLSGAEAQLKGGSGHSRETRGMRKERIMPSVRRS